MQVYITFLMFYKSKIYLFFEILFKFLRHRLYIYTHTQDTCVYYLSSYSEIIEKEFLKNRIETIYKIVLREKLQIHTKMLKNKFIIYF